MCCLRKHSAGCIPSARIGAIAFIDRFDFSLNEHTHFHCCIVDGVFQSAAKIGDTTGAADAVAGVDFHAANAPDTAAIATVQAQVCQRILRAIGSPLRAIVHNAGNEPSVVVNAASSQYGDMMEMSVIEPTKVTRSALL